MSGIIWLVSYPKSGNTWMRLFLTNYRRDANRPADINEMDSMPIASGRQLFDEETGVESSDLTVDEIDRLRPVVYQRLAQHSDETVHMKVHDAYLYLPNGEPLFPPEVTSGVLYMIRNPLDVVVSLAAHCGARITEIMQDMVSDTFALCGIHARLEDQLRQRLLSWSGHVRSWVDSTEKFPVHVVRYEDMSRQPQHTFAQVVRFLGLPLDEERLHKALAFSAFDLAQRQEQTTGFQERPSTLKMFFRKGQVGTWREHLDISQVAQMLAAHQDIMRRFGYLTADGEPVY
jgi:aryl sulfotransferase